MSKFDRRYKGEETHTLDGAPWWDGIVVVTVVFFGGAGMWLYMQARNLFWWAFRLHFLGQPDHVLAAYHIDNPGKERTHARVVGACMGLGPTCFVVWYYTGQPAMLVLAPVLLVGYTYLTIVYFLNKRDDPVAYSWDVGGDDE